MTTARTIIKRAMQKIGVLVKSETSDDDEADDALDSLNALLDSWSNYSDNITSRELETFNLSSTAVYLIGDGQTFNTVRPLQIIDAYISNGDIDYPVEIINQEDYDRISSKNTAGQSYVLTYDNAYPYGTITLFPVPDASYTLTLLSEKPITTFTTLDTSLSLPAGWERALIYNLALELAPEYGQQPDASIVKIAADALGAVKLSVVRARPILNVGDVSVRNIYTGYWS